MLDVFGIIQSMFASWMAEFHPSWLIYLLKIVIVHTHLLGYQKENPMNLYIKYIPDSHYIPNDIPIKS